jgi:hypothetical protein
MKIRWKLQGVFYHPLEFDIVENALRNVLGPAYVPFSASSEKEVDCVRKPSKDGKSYKWVRN